MRTDDFDYNLPEELIAQEPAAVRDDLPGYCGISATRRLARG